MRSASATVEAAHFYRTNGSLSGFTELVAEGVSYEMATALHMMAVDSDGAEVAVAWDPAVEVPGRSELERVELLPADADILRRGAAQLLENAATPTRRTITGRVHLLSRREAGGPGIIGVENISTDRPRKVRVHLNDDDYHRALTAHDEDRAVIVEGRVDREASIFWMYSGRLLEVLGTFEEIRSLVARSSVGEVAGQTSLDDWSSTDE